VLILTTSVNICWQFHC